MLGLVAAGFYVTTLLSFDWQTLNLVNYSFKKFDLETLNIVNYSFKKFDLETLNIVFNSYKNIFY